MLRAVKPGPEDGQELGRAVRAFLQWLSRTRTKTITVDLVVMGRQIVHLEVDVGRS